MTSLYAELMNTLNHQRWRKENCPSGLNGQQWQILGKYQINAWISTAIRESVGMGVLGISRSTCDCVRGRQVCRVKLQGCRQLIQYATGIQRWYVECERACEQQLVSIETSSVNVLQINFRRTRINAPPRVVNTPIVNNRYLSLGISF